MSGASTQWTDQDLLTLLCVLNFRIEEIRSATMEDQRRGLILASELASKEIGDGCTPARVERKIRQLWATYGKPDGDRNPYDVCMYGAFPRTLPGIDSTLFSAVTSCVQDKQRNAESSKAPSSSARPRPSPTRRSRRKLANKQEDPVSCRCGFTHHILCVHCDECATWQHAYCYYETEDESKLPEHHLCDDCGPVDERPLHQALERLHLQSEKASERRKRLLEYSSLHDRDSSQPQSMGPFGLPIDEQIMWGPDDGEIHNYLDIISSQLHGVANSLEPELEVSKACVDNSGNPDTSTLAQTVLGLNEDCWLRPEFTDPTKHRAKRRQLLRAILAAAMTGWVFHTPDPPRATYESTLLFHYQQEIFEKHGLSLLESLHRRAFISMMEDTSPLQGVIQGEAEELADRFLEAVLPITVFGQRRPTPSMHEWVASNPSGEDRRERLIQAFKFTIKLKRWLPLTRQCFEIYVPTLGSRPTMEQAVKLDDSPMELNEVVKLCLMPGLVEYPADLFLSGNSGPHSLYGDRNLVRASEEQRKVGRIVCPATVIAEVLVTPSSERAGEPVGSH